MAIRLGLAESSAAATAVVGEISSAPDARGGFKDRPPECVVFLECLGLSADALRRSLASLKTRIAEISLDAGLRWGISPHAPYSTSVELTRELVGIAKRRQVPLAMHLAESRDELELLSTGQGKIRQLLEELGAWESSRFSVGTTVRTYLELLADHDRSLIIHGNYLAEDDLEFVAANGNRICVVYCPRTHAYFGHDRYPLAQMLRRGIRVAIATDSRASNPDLNVANDVVCAAKAHPDVAPIEFLRMVTANAARGLGVESYFGSLAPGRADRLAIIPLNHDSPRDPLEAWLEGLTRCLALNLDRASSQYT
jgi:cytosine/adenosine deaminase-related metal-dependent hydrolase